MNKAIQETTPESGQPLKVGIGFENHSDVQVLRDALARYNADAAHAQPPRRPILLVSQRSNAEMVFSDALALELDLVLLNPRITGYHHGLLNELLLCEQRPIPVIGWIPAHSGLGVAMEQAGAKGTISLPMTEAGCARFMQLAATAVNQAWRERAEGRTAFARADLDGAGDLAYQRQTIAVWVPKGGGSTRTTLATNLAVALAHMRLGGIATVLADLDMTKGDCHTYLGLAPDATEGARCGQPYVVNDLHHLVSYAAERGHVDAAFLQHYLLPWRNGEARLTLLPGFTNPAHAAAKVYQRWALLYDLANELLDTLRRKNIFLILDLGQDFSVPFHRAALEQADVVLVPVPPVRSAVLDTARALPALRAQLGDLDKFSLVVTAYDPAFGLTEAAISELVALPLLTTIPHAAQIAHTAINTGQPFVLDYSDTPLGRAVIELAGVFYPPLQARAVAPTARFQPLQTLKRLMFTEV